MCLFVAPVADVSNTRIAVLSHEETKRQTVIYDTKVKLTGPTTMVLPVPGGTLFA